MRKVGDRDACHPVLSSAAGTATGAGAGSSLPPVKRSIHCRCIRIPARREDLESVAAVVGRVEVGLVQHLTRTVAGVRTEELVHLLDVEGVVAAGTLPVVETPLAEAHRLAVLLDERLMGADALRGSVLYPHEVGFPLGF